MNMLTNPRAMTPLGSLPVTRAAKLFSPSFQYYPGAPRRRLGRGRRMLLPEELLAGREATYRGPAQDYPGKFKS